MVLPKDLKMFENLKAELKSIMTPKKRFDQVFQKLEKIYPDGEDPWGLNLEIARTTLELVWPLYEKYFRVRIFGASNVEDKPYMIISNHSGQIAIDGLLLSVAFAAEVDPPRILRAMVDRFFVALPFVGKFGTEGGAVLGDRQNCLQLLGHGQSVLVFPEGVSGVAKSTKDYYKLQKFTKGFFRLALASKDKTEILPVAVVGAEEAYPYVYQARGLAKFLGLPALPLSPTFPLLGPLGMLPLPSPIDIHIGKPYKLPDLSPDAGDKKISEHVEAIKSQIADMIEKGRKQRREFWGNKLD